MPETRKPKATFYLSILLFLIINVRLVALLYMLLLMFKSTSSVSLVLTLTNVTRIMSQLSNSESAGSYVCVDTVLP